MNQHTWVYGCYAYYLENYIEPGNPEDGVWEAAHWPVPKCLGGTKTILLLKEHHAVQGVLQSEEWQHPCIFGWEKNYLNGNMLALYYKWKAKAGFNSYTSADRRVLALNREKAQTPEQRSERQTRAAETRRRNGRYGFRTPETRAEMVAKTRSSAREMHANRTPEERSAIARKGHETRRLRRLGLSG
jgi:hypothetical protein